MPTLLELISRMPEGEGAGPGAPETIEPTQGRPGAGGHGPTGPGGPAMRLFGREPAASHALRAGASDAPLVLAASLSMALTVLEWGAVAATAPRNRP